MQIKPMGLFNTPDDWKVIEDWIQAHPVEDRMHLWTAAGMAWNLAAKLTEPELEPELEVE